MGVITPVHAQGVLTYSHGDQVVQLVVLPRGITGEAAVSWCQGALATDTWSVEEILVDNQRILGIHTLDHHDSILVRMTWEGQS
jgi:hypothetical protein